MCWEGWSGGVGGVGVGGGGGVGGLCKGRGGLVVLGLFLVCSGGWVCFFFGWGGGGGNRNSSKLATSAMRYCSVAGERIDG